MDELDETDRAVVAGLVAGRTATEIGAGLGLSSQAVYFRYRRPVMRAAVAEARGAEWVPAAARLRSEVERSIDTLVSLRDGPGHPSTRLRAAVSIIELACKLHELAETGPRLAALEHTYGEASGDVTFGGVNHAA